MGWDKGSQARDLRSQTVGSGSVVLQGDQGSSIPTENAEMRFNWSDLPPL